MPLLRYLADTNVISARMARDPAMARWWAAHADEIAISTVTIGEISRGIEIKGDTKAGRQLQKAFRFIMEDFGEAVWCLDEAAAMEWGRLMAESRAHNHPLPLADSYMSAIARSMGAKIITADKKGFAGCARVDPWTGLEHAAWQSSPSKRASVTHHY
jgi:predicted nucleic acid-binding protein